MNTLSSRNRYFFAGVFLASALIIWLSSGLHGCDRDSSDWLSQYNPAQPEVPVVIEVDIDTLAAQIGGGTQDVALYNDGATDWTLYTMANITPCCRWAARASAWWISPTRLRWRMCAP